MHQIGNTFTRLPASIEFILGTAQSQSVTQPGAASASGLNDDNNAVCILGEPAAKFATVHSPALVNAWHDKLQRCLNEPVQLEQRKGHRRVGVLGTAIFDFDADGLLTVYDWDFDDNDRVMLKKLPPSTVAIQGTPYQSLWMDRFTLGALRALQQSHPGKAALCQAYVAWVQTNLAKRLWTPEVQASVRYQIAIALDLDLWAVDVASQIQVTTQPKLPMRAYAYNLAVRYRKDFETLQKEAPQLIPLYALLAQETSIYNRPEHTEVTARMQHLLRRDGINPATWRLLCRVGSDWMKEFLAFYSFQSEAPAEVAIDILTLTQAFGTQQLVPAGMLHALLQLGGNPNAPGSGYTRRLDDLFPLCARLGHLLEKAGPDELALLQDRALAIFAWASDHLKEMPKGYLRRATLRGLLRKVDLQIKCDALRQQNQRGWDVPYQLVLKTPDLEAVILDSPLAIWSEGQAMHHCAANWITPCARGQCLMVSLRSPSKSRPVATLTFDMRGRQVVPHKMSGFANVLVNPEVREIAQDCCRQLQLQRLRIRRQHAKTMGITQNEEG